MPACPRCQHLVDSQAIACPACKTPLKAFGHPGIALHQAKEGESLCPTCAYHQDDSCNFPQRPDAMQCTLYQPLAPATEVLPKQRISYRAWLQRHSRALLWIGLAIICVLIALR